MHPDFIHRIAKNGPHTAPSAYACVLKNSQFPPSLRKVNRLRSRLWAIFCNGSGETDTEAAAVVPRPDPRSLGACPHVFASRDPPASCPVRASAPNGQPGSPQLAASDAHLRRTGARGAGRRTREPGDAGTRPYSPGPAREARTPPDRENTSPWGERLGGPSLGPPRPDSANCAVRSASQVRGARPAPTPARRLGSAPPLCGNAPPHPSSATTPPPPPVTPPPRLSLPPSRGNSPPRSAQLLLASARGGRQAGKASTPGKAC